MSYQSIPKNNITAKTKAILSCCNIKIRLIASAICCLLLVVACNNTSKTGKPLSTVRSGTVKIAVDATFQPIIETELKAFHNQTPDAKVEAVYVNEKEAMRLFMLDSVQLVVIPRKLSTPESDYFKKVRKYPAQTSWFAIDGLVLVTHPSNPDSLLTEAQVQDILSGKISDWQQINPKSNIKGNIQAVFDENNSSLLRYAQDSILKGKVLSSKLSATQSNAQVLAYVQQNPNALGFIGFNWISNLADPAIDSLRKKVTMVGIYNNEQEKHYSLADDVMYRLTYRRYPYRRNIYLHCREPYVGLATGFTSFLAGKEGQTIAYKANLVPAAGIIRLVEVKEEKIPEITK